MRQDEPLLIQAISELADGHCSPSTAAFLRSLDPRYKPLTAEHVTVFALRALAKSHNIEELNKIPSPLHSYVAIDKGSQEDLAKIDIEKVHKF